MIIVDSAFLWCFAVRRSAKARAIILSTPTECVVPVDRGVTLTGETRLAANLDKLIELAIII